MPPKSENSRVGIVAKTVYQATTKIPGTFLNLTSNPVLNSSLNGSTLTDDGSDPAITQYVGILTSVAIDTISTILETGVFGSVISGSNSIAASQSIPYSHDASSGYDAQYQSEGPLNYSEINYLNFIIEGTTSDSESITLTGLIGLNPNASGKTIANTGILGTSGALQTSFNSICTAYSLSQYATVLNSTILSAFQGALGDQTTFMSNFETATIYRLTYPSSSPPSSSSVLTHDVKKRAGAKSNASKKIKKNSAVAQGKKGKKVASKKTSRK